MAPVELDAAGLSHQGHVRPDNEDQFLIASLHKHLSVRDTTLPNRHMLAMPGDSIAHLLLVADGVGGSAGGKQASGRALEAIAGYATGTMHCYYSGDPAHEQDFLNDLRQAVLQSHAAVLDAGQREPGLAGMATTLTMAVVSWPVAYVVQVGDSRCYHLHQGKLIQVTRDQTVAQDLVDEGLLTDTAADRSPLSHVLSSAIGGETPSPVVSRIGLDQNDTLLLCTDGLIEHLTDEDILAELDRGAGTRETATALVQSALDKGGRDNVTVVVARPSIPAVDVENRTKP
jgi:protein phosphatase